MIWFFIMVAAIPLIFCPKWLYNCFVLPQSLALSLLSAAGLVLGVYSGVISTSTPSILLFCFLIYFILTTLWSEPEHNTRKEFGFQLPFIITAFIGFTYFDKQSILLTCIAISIVLLLNSIYSYLQTRSIDPLFKNEIKKGGSINGAIGSIGNTNFLASFFCGSIWLSLYVAIQFHVVFLIITACGVFMIYKTKVRAGQFGMIGSFLFVFFVLAYFDLLPEIVGKSSILFNIFLGILILSIIFGIYFLIENWKTFFHKKMDPKGEQVWYATFRYRLCYWLSAIHLIKQKPLFGHGLWAYRRKVYAAQAELNEKYQDFLDPKRYITPQPRMVHNDFLEHLVEYGVIGFLLFYIFVGSVYFYGFKYLLLDIGSIEFYGMLILLTNLTCLLLNSVFFFALRVSASALMFWLTCGMIVALSCKSNVVLGSSLLLTVFVSILLILLVWHCVIKRVLASYHFIRYQVKRNYNEEIYHLNEAIKWMPYDNTYRTYACIETMKHDHALANLHATRLFEHFDGQVPLWSMLFNVGLARVQTKNIFDEALFFLKESHRFLPSFKPTLFWLNSSDGVAVKAKYKGGKTFMRRVEEAIYYRVKLLFKEKENIQLRLQVLNENLKRVNEGIAHTNTKLECAEVHIQNALLTEKKRLNIPDEWIYNMETGEFKDPQAMSDEEINSINKE